MGEGILYNIDSVSSQAISGGHITTGYTPVAGTDVANKTYADSVAGGGSYYAADIIIYKSSNTYYAKRGTDGTIINSDVDASTLFNSVLSPFTYTYVASGTYNISSTINIPNHSTLYGGGAGTQFKFAEGTYDGFYITGQRRGTTNNRTRNILLGNFSVHLPTPGTNWYSGNIVHHYSHSDVDDWKERSSIVQTTVEKIYIHAGSPDNWDDGILSGATAIRYSATGSRSCIFNTMCRDIDINGVSRGIHIYTSTGNLNNNAWINSLWFKNIWINCPRIGVEFDNNLTRGGTSAIMGEFCFDCVEIQTLGRTTDGFKNISTGGHQFNKCVVYDWGNADNPNFAWSIYSSATDITFIGTDAWLNVPSAFYDSGTKTTYIGQDKNQFGEFTRFTDNYELTGSNAHYRFGVNNSGWFYIKDLKQTATYPFIIASSVPNYSLFLSQNNNKPSFRVNFDGMSSTKEFQNIDVRDYQLFVSGDSWSHKIRCYGLSSQGISGGSIQTNLISSQTGIYADWVSGNATNLVPGAGLSNVVEDTTPQLGGDLDANDKPIYDSTGISSAAFSGGTIYGHHRYIVQTKTANYSALVGEYVLASNTITIKLPDSHNSGDNITVKNIGTGTVTVSGQSGDTIDGDVDYDMQFQYESVTVISDGTNWYII